MHLTYLTASSAVPCCQLLMAGGCSPDLRTPHGEGCPARPPGLPDPPRGSGATSLSPHQRSYHMQSDVQGHKTSLIPAGLTSPHQWELLRGRTGGCCPMEAPERDGVSVPQTHLQAPLPACNGNALLCFGAVPFTKT